MNTDNVAELTNKNTSDRPRNPADVGLGADKAPNKPAYKPGSGADMGQMGEMPATGKKSPGNQTPKPQGYGY